MGPPGKTGRPVETVTRTGVSAQIYRPKTENLQVSARRIPQTREREPSQVTHEAKEEASKPENRRKIKQFGQRFMKKR
jgi:hypothetical protein